MFCLKRILSPIYRTSSCFHTDIHNFNSIPRRLFFTMKPRPPKEFDVDKFTVVYQLPFVSYCGIFIRTKYMKVLLLSSTIPVAIYSYKHESMTQLSVAAVVISVILASLFFLCAPNYVKNLIGKIYVNKTGKEEQIVFSYLNHKGLRHNTVCNINDVSLSDGSGFISRKFFKEVTVKGFDVKLKFIYNEKHIVNPRKFFSLFPSLLQLD